LFFTLAGLAGLSNLLQSNITDYYKTLHLYFISKAKGAEFTTSEQVIQKHQQTKRGIAKALFFLYRWYSMLQITVTPQLQNLLHRLHIRYGEDFPENIRLQLRQKSKALMPQIDRMTFNDRSVVLFLSVLSGFVWIYFIYEIVVLNCVLVSNIRRHEQMCKNFI
ncbi:MAG: CDP-alcohol phosphatidyltransferase, partial [Dysgonamonadaceae bacterium]|nr:CDP-alcohol phosphatidyltransferase [Dysgonamonadaceae bacterium]